VSISECLRQAFQPVTSFIQIVCQGLQSVLGVGVSAIRGLLVMIGLVAGQYIVLKHASYDSSASGSTIGLGYGYVCGSSLLHVWWLTLVAVGLGGGYSSRRSSPWGGGLAPPRYVFDCQLAM
jgi:hypothetical protein